MGLLIYMASVNLPPSRDNNVVERWPCSSSSPDPVSGAIDMDTQDAISVTMSTATAVFVFVSRGVASVVAVSV